LGPGHHGNGINIKSAFENFVEKEERESWKILKKSRNIFFFKLFPAKNNYSRLNGSQ
jgi:hypothetical protein